MRITDENIRAFAELSGDKNPIHLDDEYAADSRFKKRIAHGFLVGSLISAKIAKKYPGAIYITQRMTFRKPVYIGDEVEAEITIENQIAKKLYLTTICKNQLGETVISGGAIIIYETK